uniref:DNA-directed DNA/RNA polymerase mu n=1 Tax=Gouania willdenowi TaxID=441366 RepID=A0A8C5E791_GOUWI
MFHEVPSKRSKMEKVPVSMHKDAKFESVRLYLVERKMGSSRRAFLTQLARSKGFIVEDILSDVVTHIVSEDCQASSLWTWLEGHGVKTLPMMQVLDITWFTDSMKQGKPVAVEPRHLIQVDATTSTPVAKVSQYACQRRTTTANSNKIFTDAFEVLAESYEFNEMEGQSLAFRRAASVLRSLPSKIQSLRDAESLPFLGKHSIAVIEEILQCGFSMEVQKILSNERFKTLKLFMSVFGVGLKTAEKWYRKGLLSFSDILAAPGIHLNRMQQNGFLHYGDISRAVSKAEAQALGNIIDETVHAITSDALLTLTGGFRRYKTCLLLSVFILKMKEYSTLFCLLSIGLILYCDYRASTFDMSRLPNHKFDAMDHFAKCFLILRLDGSRVEGGLCGAEGDGRGWRAVRVDLVSPPMKQYAFTLLGWTGSKQFERDLRRFAQKERHMLLDNHALYDKTKVKQLLAATTEQDIFAHLGLQYIEPCQRNA